MPSSRLAAILLVACAAIAVPAGEAATVSASRTTLSPHASSKLSSTRRAILNCTNRERAKHGLRALRQSRPLRRAAQFHARNMLRYRFFAHKDNVGRSPAQRVLMFERHNRFHYIGENIAADFLTGQAACHSWMVSATHRHNILDPDYKWIGVGYAGGGYESYFVQDFGG
jgi:uncharacterized protein YkwD